MTYQDYIVNKLQDLAFLERVNAQTKQINLTQTTLIEIADPELTSADLEDFTRESIEKNFAWKMEDRRQKNKKAFEAIQARSFEKASMSALYGEDSL